jgi:hypothetical protein
MLFFRSEEHVNQWCKTHGLPRQPILDLNQLWHLAIKWYESRLTVESRRPGPDEMTHIFAEIGLDGPFWDPSADLWE